MIYFARGFLIIKSNRNYITYKLQHIYVTTTQIMINDDVNKLGQDFLI